MITEEQVRAAIRRKLGAGAVPSNSEVIQVVTKFLKALDYAEEDMLMAETSQYTYGLYFFTNLCISRGWLVLPEEQK